MAADWQKDNLMKLFVAHRRELVGYASTIVGERSLAEDVVQDAYIRVTQATDGWHADRLLEEPLGYLYRIIRNLAIDRWRKRSREEAVVSTGGNDDINRVSNNQPTPEMSAIPRDDLRLLQNALDELPLRTRQAFEMHRFGGCKLTTIAERLGVSVGTAHSLVIDALDHCKQRVRTPGRPKAGKKN